MTTITTKEKIILFSRQQKKVVIKDGRKFYDGKEFTEIKDADGKPSEWEDAVIIFQGIPDPKKFRYYK